MAFLSASASHIELRTTRACTLKETIGLGADCWAMAKTALLLEHVLQASGQELEIMLYKLAADPNLALLG